MTTISHTTIRPLPAVYASANGGAARRVKRFARNELRADDKPLEDASPLRRGVWDVVVLILLSLAVLAGIIRRRKGGDDDGDGGRIEDTRTTAPMRVVRPETLDVEPAEPTARASTSGETPPGWSAIVERVRAAAAEADEMKRRESSLRRLVGSTFGKATDWVAEAAMGAAWEGKMPRFNWMQPAYLHLIAHRLIERNDDLYDTGIGLSIALAAYWASVGDARRTECAVRAVQSMARDNPMWAGFFLQEMSSKDRYLDAHAQSRAQREYAGEEYAIDDILSFLVQGIASARDWEKGQREYARSTTCMLANLVIGKLATARKNARYEQHPVLARLAARIRHMVDAGSDETLPPWACWAEHSLAMEQPTPDEIMSGGRMRIGTKIDEPAGSHGAARDREPLSMQALHVIDDVVAALHDDAKPAEVTRTILRTLGGYWGDHVFGAEAARSLSRMDGHNILAMVASSAELACITRCIPLARDHEFALISFMHHLARAGIYWHASSAAISSPVKIELLGSGGAQGALTVARDVLAQIEIPAELGRYVETFARMVDAEFGKLDGGTNGGGGGGALPPTDEPQSRGNHAQRLQGLWRRSMISVDRRSADMIETVPLSVLAGGMQAFLGCAPSVVSMGLLQPVVMITK